MSAGSVHNLDACMKRTRAIVLNNIRVELVHQPAVCRRWMHGRVIGSSVANLVCVMMFASLVRPKRVRTRFKACALANHLSSRCVL